MIKINVFSEEILWNKKLTNKEVFFKNVCKFFPKKYKFSNKRINLTLLLSNNHQIKKLNYKFKKKNKHTDILSFPFEKNLKSKKDIYLGDIIISYEHINKPKTIKKTDFRKRLIKIFIHGFLHLLGFDHKKNNDYEKMLDEEKKIFKSVYKNLD